jgi:hypothetical protein
VVRPNLYFVIYVSFWSSWHCKELLIDRNNKIGS